MSKYAVTPCVDLSFENGHGEDLFVLQGQWLWICVEWTGPRGSPMTPDYYYSQNNQRQRQKLETEIKGQENTL